MRPNSNDSKNHMYADVHEFSLVANDQNFFYAQCSFVHDHAVASAATPALLYGQAVTRLQSISALYKLFDLCR